MRPSKVSTFLSCVWSCPALKSKPRSKVSLWTNWSLRLTLRDHVCDVNNSGRKRLPLRLSSLLLPAAATAAATLGDLIHSHSVPSMDQCRSPAIATQSKRAVAGSCGKRTSIMHVRRSSQRSPFFLAPTVSFSFVKKWKGQYSVI